MKILCQRVDILEIKQIFLFEIIHITTLWPGIPSGLYQRDKAVFLGAGKIKIGCSHIPGQPGVGPGFFRLVNWKLK